MRIPQLTFVDRPESSRTLLACPLALASFFRPHILWASAAFSWWTLLSSFPEMLTSFLF